MLYSQLTKCLQDSEECIKYHFSLESDAPAHTESSGVQEQLLCPIHLILPALQAQLWSCLLRLSLSQLLRNSKPLLLLTSLLSFHTSLLLWAPVSPQPLGNYYSLPLFLFQMGLELCGGSCIMDCVGGEAAKQSDILLRYTTVQMSCYSQSILVSFSSFSCSDKCLLFFLLRYVTESLKGIGIFRNQEEKLGECDKDEEKNCSA